MHADMVAGYVFSFAFFTGIIFLISGSIISALVLTAAVQFSGAGIRRWLA